MIDSKKSKNYFSCYENLSNEELSEIVLFGFTKTGFSKFKAAFEAAKEKVCQRQK